MSAVCPACGVPVVPGYVRCPKCHAGLPIGRAKRTTAEPGGTAVVQRGFPVSAVIVAVAVAAAIILLFGFRGSSKKIEAAPAAPAVPIEAVASSPRPVPRIAPAVIAPAAPPPAPVAADPRAATAELESLLRRQRLWGRAQVTGARVDVRSGSCGDPAMKPAIAGEQAALRGAGLTKLRCLEQSGAVVFERDL